MKKVLMSFCAAAMVCTAFGQDVNQAKGTWYLGSADATELLGIFSEGVNVSPFVAYAIADNIAITVGINYGSLTTDAVGDVPESTMSSSEISLGAAYFFGDNFYGQVGLSLGSTSMTGAEDMSSTGFGVRLGKFIPVKDMWYVSPNLTYEMGTNDTGSANGASIAIAFGARF
ncbi:MAG: hypothetical protein P8K81_06400 [Flavobacteriales bacterium]|nr:hypothetical protein [Flavobacteriales bacterium]